MKIVQIKGSNGSGKTTIVKQLISYSYGEEIIPGDKGEASLTHLRDLGWIVIGEYGKDSKMGGCDLIHTVAAVKDGLWKAYDLAREVDAFGIVFEGMMISTIKSTFYNFLLEMKDTDIGIEPLFVILRASPEGCLKRLKGRGTMKADLKVDNIRAKCENVVRHAQTYDQKYVRVIDVDAIPRRLMLAAFLDEVGDDRALWFEDEQV